MGIVWVKAESEAWRASLKSAITRWSEVTLAWTAPLDSMAALTAAGPGSPLSGQAWNAMQTLFIERILPLVRTAQSGAAWAGQALKQYEAAEAPLHDDDRLDETILQSAVDHAHAAIRDLQGHTTPRWLLPKDVRDLYDRQLAAFRDVESKTASKLAALRTFAGRVDGLFSEEVALVATLRAAVSSISRGSLSGDGTYVPAPGDDEAWRQAIEDYLSTHPVVADQAAVVDDMIAELRAAGLLTGDVSPYYMDWLMNAAGRGVSADTICDIARQFGLTPDTFSVLDKCGAPIRDPDGKVYFVIPPGVSPAEAMLIVFLTAVINAGTDYGSADDTPSAHAHDSFTEVGYSPEELERIRDRIRANSATYTLLLPTMAAAGGVVVSTPNGMMMGVGQPVSWQDRLTPWKAVQNAARDTVNAMSQAGGTTYGDMFMVNIDDSTDPRDTLANIITGGVSVWNGDPTGSTPAAYGPNQGSIDLDRLLHHEEVHSQQWAKEGPGYAASYTYQQATGLTGADNPYEQDAGLEDGGYQ